MNLCGMRSILVQCISVRSCLALKVLLKDHDSVGGVGFIQFERFGFDSSFLNVNAAPV